MKRGIIVVLLLVTLVYNVRAEFFSFYFKKDAILVLNSVNKVNPRLFGKYELNNTAENEVRRAAGEYLLVDETGLYIEKNRLSSISRNEIRENSKYHLSRGWLHGVVENDSLPCALDGENYFFLIATKTYLFQDVLLPNRLIQITPSKYALFSFENNGHFSAIVASFSPNGVQLNDIVFSTQNLNKIEKVEKKEEGLALDNGIKTYILTPSKEEWDSFVFAKCLETYDTYLRVIQ